MALHEKWQTQISPPHGHCKFWPSGGHSSVSDSSVSSVSDSSVSSVGCSATRIGASSGDDLSCISSELLGDAVPEPLETVEESFAIFISKKRSTLIGTDLVSPLFRFLSATDGGGAAVSITVWL